MVDSRAGELSAPCGCVLRAICRACLAKCQSIGEHRRVMQVSAEKFQRRRGRETGVTFGRRNEEFVADVWLVARRVLSSAEFRCFRFHLDEQKALADRIELKLGRAFRELQPYALFPIDEYFTGGRLTDANASTSLLPGSGMSREDRSRAVLRVTQEAPRGWGKVLRTAANQLETRLRPAVVQATAALADFASAVRALQATRVSEGGQPGGSHRAAQQGRCGRRVELSEPLPQLPLAEDGSGVREGK